MGTHKPVGGDLPDAPFCHGFDACPPTQKYFSTFFKKVLTKGLYPAIMLVLPKTAGYGKSAQGAFLPRNVL